MKIMLVYMVAGFTAICCPRSLGQSYDLDGKTPKDLLERLTTAKSQVVVSKPVKNWVKPEHIVELLPMLDSKVECISVARLESPWANAEKSTIGNEVAYLILGFKEEVYPPKLDSVVDNENCVRDAKEFVREVFRFFAENKPVESKPE